MNEHPFFSLVIPTRNRHETLPYAIETILQQSFVDYELIICDNNSSVETKKIVKSFNSEKIKYIYSDKDLSMVENWELALSIAKGKYVSVIADNDGFIDGSLSFLYDLLELNRFPSIIRWEKNAYNWPDLEAEIRNILVLNTEVNFQRIDGKKVISEVIENKTKFQMLPMIYNSVISMSLINVLKRKTGRIFHSVSPDVYTGYAFAYLAEHYLSLKMPLTIGSNSSKSTGYNNFKKSNKIEKEFKTLSNNSEFSFHPKIPFVKNLYAAVCESFLRVQEELKIKDITLNRKEAMQKIIKNVFVYDNAELSAVQASIIHSCSDDLELMSFVKDYLKEVPLCIVNSSIQKREFGFMNGQLHLDGDAFQLSNIYQVSSFMAKFYNYNIEKTNFPELSSDFKEIQKRETVVVWGSGEASKALQKEMLICRPDINIKFLVDSFKENVKTEPRTILPSAITQEIQYIIIASMYANEIGNTLKTLALHPNIIILKFQYKNPIRI